MLDTLKKITMSCRKVFTKVMLNLIQHLPPMLFRNSNNPGGRFQIKFGMTCLQNNHAFTLIELLVVVLIIGILASVALPQYQVAVMKSRLATYMPLVKALYEAQELYFLENGQYTTDLSALDIDLPVSGCTYTSKQSAAYYKCSPNNFFVGVQDGPTNAQVGDDSIRFMKFFEPKERFDTQKGDTACFSRGEVARKACRSLGPGREEQIDNGWDYQYFPS